MIIKLGKFFCCLLFLLFIVQNINGQDTTLPQKIYYRFAIGSGIGTGYPLQEVGNDYGLGGIVEFSIQKNKNLYTLGWKGVYEFQLFSNSNVLNAISSIDVSFGKCKVTKNIFTSISTGIGLIITTQKGALLSQTITGLLSSNSTYEKINNTTIGLPISAKIVWTPYRNYGIGINLYANFNKLNNFYGADLIFQKGFFRSKTKK